MESFYLTFRHLQATKSKGYSVPTEERNLLFKHIWQCSSTKFTMAILTKVPYDCSGSHTKPWTALLSSLILKKECKDLLEAILSRPLRVNVSLNEYNI